MKKDKLLSHKDNPGWTGKSPTLLLGAACIILLSLPACSFSNTVILDSPTPEPTLIPLHDQISMTTSSYTENGKGPDYTISINYPVLGGVEDERLSNFNRAAQQMVKNETSAFKDGLGYMTIEPIAMGSALDIKYRLVSEPGKIVSVIFDIYTYMDGAAHPYSYTRTFNYDVDKGLEIWLDQLFLPDAKYLDVLSEYCIAELNKRGIDPGDLVTAGAGPSPENYRNWNIAPEGLMITFDPYQVAAYAAGPQVVVIPYDAIREWLDPQGPLKSLLEK